MKLPSITTLWTVGAFVGAVLGTFVTGCPSAGCPQCTIKKAQFTIPRAEGAITEVVMDMECKFTGHCDGERDPDGCKLSETERLGVLRENERIEEPLPWETDDDDECTVEVEVTRQLADGSKVVQTPGPSVTIVR